MLVFDDLGTINYILPELSTSHLMFPLNPYVALVSSLQYVAACTFNHTNGVYL